MNPNDKNGQEDFSRIVTLNRERGWVAWWQRCRRAVRREIAVDLGTAYVRVYQPGSGIILEAPSLIALEEQSSRVVAVGLEARAILGREPVGVRVVQPVKDGVIDDVAAAAALLRYVFERVGQGRRAWWLHVVLATPSDCTPLELQSAQTAARQAGATRVTLLEEAVASALGAEMQAEGARASVVVDIGAGTTDLAVVSRGALVQGRTSRLGSGAFEQAVMDYLRQERSIETGLENAERIKLALATLEPEAGAGQFEFRGRNLNTRLPEFFIITRAEVRQAIEPVAQKLTAFVRASLEDLPLKAALDVLDTGIVLSGGGALLPGLPEWLAGELKLGVWLAAEPSRTTIKGLARLLAVREERTAAHFLLPEFIPLAQRRRLSLASQSEPVQVKAVERVS